MALTYCFLSGRFTHQMLKDSGYYHWTHEKRGYEPKYLEAFARDTRFRHRFLGEAVDSLHALFPELYGAGVKYNPEALREGNLGHNFRQYPDSARLQVYRLGSTERGSMYCVLVVDGKVSDFFFVNPRAAP